MLGFASSIGLREVEDNTRRAVFRAARSLAGADQGREVVRVKTRTTVEVDRSQGSFADQAIHGRPRAREEPHHVRDTQ